MAIISCSSNASIHKVNLTLDVQKRCRAAAQKGGVIDSHGLLDCAGVSTNRRGTAQTLTSTASKAIRVQCIVQRV